MLTRDKDKNKNKQEFKQSLFKLKSAKNISPKDCYQSTFQHPFGVNFEQKKNKEINQEQIQTIQNNNYEGLLGQLTLEYLSERFVGTGTLLLSNDESIQNNQRAFILTSAHNLFQFKSGKKEKIQQEEQYLEEKYEEELEQKNELDSNYQIIQAIRVFFQRNGEQYFCMLDGRYFSIYQDYFTSPKNLAGNDIALIEVINYQGLFQEQPNDGIRYRWDRSFEDINPQKGEKICLIGYPYNKRGQLFKAEGTIKSINYTQSGQITFYYDEIEPVGGQSGAPVFLFRKPCWYLIGVNAGYDDFEKTFIATGLNDKIQTWIQTKQKTTFISDLNKKSNLTEIIDASITIQQNE